MRYLCIILFLVLQISAACAYDGYDSIGFDPSGGSIEYYFSDGSIEQPISSSYNWQLAPYPQGIESSNAFWIQSSTGQQIQSMQCVLSSQIKLIAFSPGGPAVMTEVYPDGHQTYNFYHFNPGYSEIIFDADEPGTHILSYELNGQISNAVTLDVLASGIAPLIRDNLAPVLNSLNPDKSSPQPVGIPITWTANAYDSDGDPIYYKFWQGKENNMSGETWLPMRDWSTENSWTWIPNNPGNYRISVMVRDGHHTNSPDGGDGSMVTSFIVSAIVSVKKIPVNLPPVIKDFAQENPAYKGNPVTVVVDAYDPNNDQIYYKYWLMGPLPYPISDVSVWDISNYRPLTDAWLTQKRYSWTPGIYDGPVDDYIVMVEVRDGFNAPPSSWDDFSEMVISVSNAPKKSSSGGGPLKILAKGSNKRPRPKPPPPPSN